MRAQDVMSTMVQTITPKATADAAWEAMRLKGIRHLVVTDTTGAVGLVSDRDLGGRQGAKVRAGRTVADVMTSPVVVVTPDTTVRRAANLMRGYSIGSLVVSKGKKVVGIVTVSDLLELLGRGIEQPSPVRTRATLNHRVPHRKGRAGGAW